MRALVSVLVCVSALSSLPTSAAAEARAPATAGRGAEDLARARVLDRAGAKAYGDGHYNDAIRYFEEAYRLGGPPFELWNIAKCHLRLDQPEQAASLLERYLATEGLPAEDREEAAEQLEALRKRPSTLTIASSPAGAAITVDGRTPEQGSKTPASFAIPPGSHTVVLTHPSGATHAQTVEAKFGRAVILDVRLGKDGTAAPPGNPYGPDEVRRVSLRGHLGLMVPRYGSVGGVVHPALIASGTYRFADVGATSFAVGAMVLLTGDSWDNTVAADQVVQPCGALRNSRSATALSMFAIGSAGWEIVPRLRAHAIAGLGAAAYFADDLGGDVFVPSCSPSPGARPALLVGGSIDYAVTPLVRVSALPLTLQLQPSFEGTRSTPLDASGVWMRATIAIGAGVDL